MQSVVRRWSDGDFTDELKKTHWMASRYVRGHLLRRRQDPTSRWDPASRAELLQKLVPPAEEPGSTKRSAGLPLADEDQLVECLFDDVTGPEAESHRKLFALLQRNL